MKYEGWLIYDQAGAVYNENYIKMHMEEAKKQELSLDLMLAEKIQIGLDGCLYYEGKKRKNADFVICRTINPRLTKELEKMGCQVFNNSMVSEIANNKGKTYDYLSDKEIPMLEYERLSNEEFLNQYERIPVGYVIKAVDGHGGSQVFQKLENNKDEIMRGIGRSDVVIQPLLEGSKQDVRVYVIGKKIICAIKRTAKEGFRSNFSLGGSVEIYALDKEQLALVEKVIEEFSFGLVGIDFLIDKNGKFVFNEIEDVVGARMLYQLTDINLLEEYFVYILKQLLGNSSGSSCTPRCARMYENVN